MICLLDDVRVWFVWTSSKNHLVQLLHEGCFYFHVSLRSVSTWMVLFSSHTLMTGITRVMMRYTEWTQWVLPRLCRSDFVESRNWWWEFWFLTLLFRGGHPLRHRFFWPKPFPLFDQINCLAFRAEQNELVVIVLPLTARSILGLLLDDRSTTVATWLSYFNDFCFFFAHNSRVKLIKTSSSSGSTSYADLEAAPTFLPPSGYFCFCNEDSYPSVPYAYCF